MRESTLVHGGWPLRIAALLCAVGLVGCAAKGPETASPPPAADARDRTDDPVSLAVALPEPITPDRAAELRTKAEAALAAQDELAKAKASRAAMIEALLGSYAGAFSATRSVRPPPSSEGKNCATGQRLEKGVCVERKQSVPAKPPPDVRATGPRDSSEGTLTNMSSLVLLSSLNEPRITAAQKKVDALPPPPYRAVQVLFATDRAMAPGSPTQDRFTSTRGSEISFGTVEVSIPLTHRIGNLERPKWYRFEFSEDPARYCVILSKKIVPVEGFKQIIRNSPSGPALVFVHGYNVTFEDAAFRTAQMAVDLDLPSVPTFFSWPSQGAMSRYTVDEANAEWAERDFKAFLSLLADETPKRPIVLVAHSMGARMVVRGLSALLQDRPELQARFQELVLAAPDIDADVFRRDLVPRFVSAQQRVTLYASSRDKALVASHEVHGNPRAGESGDRIVIAPGLETVDASQIDTDFLGHSYFAEARTLLTDIALLLRNNLRAAQRPTLEPRGQDPLTYWAFKP